MTRRPKVQKKTTKPLQKSQPSNSLPEYHHLPNAGFEQKHLADGQINSKYVDLLEEDKPIANQKFVCVSFVSPEKILKQKDIFYFQSFLKHWPFKKSMEKFFQFLNFVCYKYNLTLEEVSKDYEMFLQDEGPGIQKCSIEDDYKTFVDQNEQELENAFNTEYQFQTSTRGLKVRGSYPTLEEAELRCKMLREIDPNHDVFVGPVGLWMPWDPEAYKTGRVEYLEEELNALMQEKNKTEQYSKTAFEQRLKESKKQAIAENIRNAEKSGATITQSVDEDGNLMGVNNMNTQEQFFQSHESISVADIRSELFEGDNIVLGQSDYGQSLLTMNQPAPPVETTTHTLQPIRQRFSTTQEDKEMMEFLTSEMDEMVEGDGNEEGEDDDGEDGFQHVSGRLKSTGGKVIGFRLD